jgi:DNA-binding MarR family transcriptional regulator
MDMVFKDCLCFSVGRISRKLNKVTKESIASYGLTTSQFFMLIALYEENGILISKLAEKVALDRATLTGLVDRLERDGLVKRTNDPNDRRAIKVYLTDKAEELRHDLLEIYHKNNSMFLSILSPKERQTFEAVVEKLDQAQFMLHPGPDG